MRYIYGLFDRADKRSHSNWKAVDDQFIRYVGGGSDIEGRRKSHINDSRKGNKTHKQKWIRSLLRQDREPEVMILEICTKANWQERERFWIASFTKGQLTNSTAGGEGLLDPTPNVRQSIGVKSQARMMGNTYRKGTSQTEETKQAISEGLKASEEFHEAHRKRRGKPSYVRTEETKRKNAETNIGRSRPDLTAFLKEFNKAKCGYKWITDGQQNKQLPKGEPLPNGWKFGITAVNHHLRGKSNPRFSDDLKALAKQRRGKMRWITDGVQTKIWMPSDELPCGWYFGRTLKVQHDINGKFTRTISKQPPNPKGDLNHGN